MGIYVITADKYEYSSIYTVTQCIIQSPISALRFINHHTPPPPSLEDCRGAPRRPDGAARGSPHHETDPHDRGRHHLPPQGPRCRGEQGRALKGDDCNDVVSVFFIVVLERDRL